MDPGNSFLYSYRLTYSTSSDQDQPLCTRLLFDIADSHFNRSGRRWLRACFRLSNSARRTPASHGR
jgi:hypothetical protein